LAWLEEALQLAYASGALKPRRFITKEEWKRWDHQIRDRIAIPSYWSIPAQDGLISKSRMSSFFVRLIDIGPF
jgi:hypothetical protein